jgi:Holliday junction resolvasome RuvABC endonuclease subunit
MIRYLFSLRQAIAADAADALAVAVCHLNTCSSRTRWNLSN